MFVGKTMAKLQVRVSSEDFLYFETIKKVLDKSVASVCASRSISEKEAVELFVKHLKNMSKEWFSGETPNIAYEDPLCRLAYLYCHVAVNANLFEYAVRQTQDLSEFIARKLEDEGELRVCGFGGGPGTECLGLAKHLWKTRSQKPHANVSFTVLDRVSEWVETWNGTEQILREFLKQRCGAYRDWPFSFNKTFTNLDIKDCTKFGNLAELFGQDLFVMNYVLSELYGDFSNFEPVFELMVKSASRGARFLIIDRDEKGIIKKARKLFESNKLIEEQFDTTSKNMDNDEQISALEPYLDKIGRKPRFTWSAFWLAGRKK